MEFIMLRNFDNYIDAHIVKGRLEAENIPCWLKDENVSALIVDPVLTNVIGGIKLMVPKDEWQRANEILSQPPEGASES